MSKILQSEDERVMRYLDTLYESYFDDFEVLITQYRENINLKDKEDFNRKREEWFRLKEDFIAKHITSNENASKDLWKKLDEPRPVLYPILRIYNKTGFGGIGEANVVIEALNKVYTKIETSTDKGLITSAIGHIRSGKYKQSCLKVLRDTLTIQKLLTIVPTQQEDEKETEGLSVGEDEKKETASIERPPTPSGGSGGLFGTEVSTGTEGSRREGSESSSETGVTTISSGGGGGSEPISSGGEVSRVDDNDDLESELPNEFDITPIIAGVNAINSKLEKQEEIKEENDWSKKLNDKTIKELYTKYYGYPENGEFPPRSVMVEQLSVYEEDISRLEIPNFSSLKLSDWTIDSLKQYLDILNTLPEEEQRFNTIFDPNEVGGFNAEQPFKFGTSDTTKNTDDTFTDVDGIEKLPSDNVFVEQNKQVNKYFGWIEENEGLLKKPEQFEKKIEAYEEQQEKLSKQVTKEYDRVDDDVMFHEAYLSIGLKDDVDPAYTATWARDEWDVITNIQIPAHWSEPEIKGKAIDEMIDRQEEQMVGDIGYEKIFDGQEPNFYNLF